MLMFAFIFLFGAFSLPSVSSAGEVTPTPSVHGKVRLVNSVNLSSFGRVEVLYNGIWGTICDDGWDLQDAEVVCRQLGYDGAVAAPHRAAYGQGTGQIWLDNVECVGNETSISECSHHGWGIHNCWHGEDASVHCKPRARLVGGPSVREGVLQVYYNNTWGWVCDDQWDKRDADVVCRMMGYTEASSVPGKSSAINQSDLIWMNNVQCTGNETSLFSCVHGLNNPSCISGYKAAVGCSVPEVRLVAGGHAAYQGRVEVFLSSLWGTVCGNSWDLQDAQVVCRQLGYDGASAAPRSAAFGPGTGAIWINDIQCTGNEASLSDCRQNTLHYCGHGSDASVVCTPPVRLVKGATAREGLVQVYHNNTWGWVCDDQWDKQDADVVCRELGFTGGYAVQSNVSSGQNNDTVWLNNAQCVGNESKLASCVNDGWWNHSCGNGGKAGVNCFVPQVRLVNFGNSSYFGRVEVLYNGLWGTVCDRFWDLQDAGVVCRLLGYDGAVAESSDASFGQGTGQIWLSYVGCVGNEKSISECNHNGWGVQNCGHSDDAGVHCKPRARLVGGPSAREGLVQVYHNNTWGWVCDDQWDKTGADVVCRMMGYTEASSVPGKSSAISQSDLIWMNNVQCNGNENTIFSCVHGLRNQSCIGGYKAAVVCSPREVRLVNAGRSPFFGRVEVLYSGIWGTVCHHGWDLQDAEVVCRQLGYDGAVAAPRQAAYGQGTGQIWLSYVRCVGNEKSISECSHNGWGIHSCSHWSDASVNCKPRVHLVQGVTAREGLVQVHYNNTWGWVCDDQWDKQDADVVCRELGYTGTYAVQSGAVNGNGNDTVWMNNVQCFGNESSLFSCNHDGWKKYSCKNSRRAGVKCIGLEVRLADGNSAVNGRVEVLYNGIWGTVCNNNWDLEDAKVVCRELGYAGAVAAVRYAVHMYGQGTGAIWMDYVDCKGNETSLLECKQRYGWGVNYCSHYYDAGVICKASVRLVGGATAREGLVQVYHNNTWGWVCDDQWDKQDANVVCRELGYTGGYAVQNSAVNRHGNETIWMNNVQCFGNESSLFSCNHDGWKNSCKNSRRAGVKCIGLEVRLADGNSNVNGRIEVLYNGAWGTVCNSNWDLEDAEVVCRQLGYAGAVAAVRYASHMYGQGTGVIWMDYVDCKGNETSLLECKQWYGWGVNYCSHYYDAGVICKASATLTPSPSIVSVEFSRTTAASVQTSILQYTSNFSPSVSLVLPILSAVTLSSVSSGEEVPPTPSVHWRDFVGQPQFVVNGLESITISWNSSRSMNFTVQTWNNGTSSWEDTRCNTSIAEGICLVDNPRATVINLRPSSLYFFKVTARDKITSSASKRMKTKELDTPGIPVFVSNSLDTITISWPPLGLQTVTYTVNTRPDDGAVWMNATCKESIRPNQCIVTGRSAEVLGLEENVLYQFRVYANYKGVRSAPSLSSEKWRTADFVGQPQFVANDLESIAISWNSSRSMNFTVQTWNNDTSSWEDTRCNASIADGICLVDNPRATVINLRPSSMFFFKVSARENITSSASKRMKTKELDTPGIPFFVSNSLDTITISWLPLGLQTVTYTINMRPGKGALWMNATCKESTRPNQCTVTGATAEVLGLEENVLYQFRIYANYKEVRSAPSLPSEALRTAVPDDLAWAEAIDFPRECSSVVIAV